MSLKKDKVNNAVIVELANVRAHPNADRIKLATVLGTQVVVDLDAEDGDLVVYFDSNLRLSREYLHYNNLYSSKDFNNNTSVTGYFGKNGKVRAQKFRGELSNGYVASLLSLGIPDVHPSTLADLQLGDEFHTIDGVLMCEKFLCREQGRGGPSNKKTKKGIKTSMFHRHWDTAQYMRNKHKVCPGPIFIEEKIHGTSGRIGYVWCTLPRRWWQWKAREEWRVLSGTRRVDNVNGHLPFIRQQIHDKVAPHLHAGEEIYFEIYGTSQCGVDIQEGFPYGCRAGEYRVMLYRVTHITPDGKCCIDLGREQVYARAAELGLESPVVLSQGHFYAVPPGCSDYVVGLEDKWDLCSLEDQVVVYSQGKSTIDVNTLLEGIVIWYQDLYGVWTCLKHKSPEFLLLESKLRDKGVEDVEDEV